MEITKYDNLDAAILRELQKNGARNHNGLE